ncbi:cytosolic carboxypeptidase-like protein 5 [Ischnura elegans]|uniref:cytosolic carboxypeptidase-like protein 5 n=1 Tax=Ischnura elegans TaxID=197161 RepID=UPI001ED8785C|nr:cytosolic carboxypeptidase-like protein 5 [Ischnura elegans]
MEVVLNGLVFSSKFDSGNLARVEPVTPIKRGRVGNDATEMEFNMWTWVDAADTEFKNSFRSWFYFSVKGLKHPSIIKCNIRNLNRHSKVFTDHMYPVYMIQGYQRWQKIKDKPAFTDSGDSAVLTFTHRIESNQKVFFALCYPYPYRDIMSFLDRIDAKYSSIKKKSFDCEEIYYYRECLCHSLEGRSVDLITITSTWGISTEREPRFKNLFPDVSVPRPHRFPNKKVIFISARVHPAETSSSFVLDGIITSLLNKEDPGAALLRRKFVFKLIPVLNPDGVVRGHYRTDTRGMNLNRVYGNPSFELHPSIYAACTLLRYYHGGIENVDNLDVQENGIGAEDSADILVDGEIPCVEEDEGTEQKKDLGACSIESRTSGLFLYLDLHSHASRKGFFLYGNNFPKLEDCIEVRVFAKLMEINCQGFLYNACDFSEASMHLKDKSGNGSREGAGRVWVMSQTGLVYSYTFEAHYNTGHVETCIPRRVFRLESKHWISFVPSEYSTPTYEGVGRAVLQSILDLNGPNAWSRVTSSSLKCLSKIRETIQRELCCKVTHKKPVPIFYRPTATLAALASFRNLSVASKVRVDGSRPVMQLAHRPDVKKSKGKDVSKDRKGKNHVLSKPVPRVCIRPLVVVSVNKEFAGVKKKLPKNVMELATQKFDAVLRVSEPPNDKLNGDDKLCCPPF